MKISFGIILLILSLWLCAPTSAQTIADAWHKMPTSIHHTIDSTARLDMTDLYRAGMKAIAPTLLGDTAQLIAMSDTYLLLRTSKASTMQIKCIKGKKKSIYAIITTVDGPVPNSHIDLYNEKWQTIPLKKHFKPLSVENFIEKSVNKEPTSSDIRNTIVIPAIQYTMNDSTNDIEATATFMQALDKESRERIAPHILPTIQLQWNGKKWK